MGTGFRRGFPRPMRQGRRLCYRLCTRLKTRLAVENRSLNQPKPLPPIPYIHRSRRPTLCWIMWWSWATRLGLKAPVGVCRIVIRRRHGTGAHAEGPSIVGASEGFGMKASGLEDFEEMTLTCTPESAVYDSFRYVALSRFGFGSWGCSGFGFHLEWFACVLSGFGCGLLRTSSRRRKESEPSCK